jgi:hypothetical protein
VRWWLSEDETVAQDLVSVYRGMRDDDGQRLASNQHHARLYGGPGRLDPEAWQDTDKRVSLNVVKNAIDAVVAKIGKQRPAPKPLTQGGSPELRRKAKLLERFLSAQFDISGVYREMPKVVLDSCVFGTGIARVFVEDDKINLERVFPGEVFVDQHDGLYGKPRSVVQKKWVSRDVLIEMFPDKERIIREANADPLASDASDPHDLFYDPRADQVLVVMGWHLPSSSKAKDGRHVIAVDSGVLEDSKWEYDFHPFIFINWNERLRGFWGQGVAEELNGIQVEINQLLQKIQASFHLAAVPRVFIDQGSKIQKAHFDNRIGAIVPYVGKPPVVVVPQTVHPEVFAHLDRLYQRAFEIVGVSQLSSRMQNPLGADASGVALQTWHDMETERFSIQAAKYEQAILDLSRMMIAFARSIGGNFAAPSQRDRNTIDRIKWSDVNMEDDQYVLQVFPVSSLPSTPAGRLRTVLAMMNAQLIGPDEAKGLLDYPDLESKLSLDRASEDLIEHVLEKMLDDGVYTRPEPFMDLRLSLKMAQAYYLRAQINEVEEERLELVRKFMRQVRVLMQKAEAEQARLAAQAAGMNAPTNGAAPPAAGPTGQSPTAVTPQDGGMSV